MQGTPNYGQPLQPMQSFDEPMQMNPSGGAQPNHGGGQPNHGGAQPDNSEMPPLPNSAYMPQQQSLYVPGNQTTNAQPSIGMRPVTYQSQGMPPTMSTQGMPIRGVSLSRVRPTSSVVEPQRTLLQRLLPGGK